MGLYYGLVSGRVTAGGLSLPWCLLLTIQVLASLKSASDGTRKCRSEVYAEGLDDLCDCPTVRHNFTITTFGSLCGPMAVLSPVADGCAATRLAAGSWLLHFFLGVCHR